jgi:hypothetical protein
MMMNRYHSILK